MLRESIAGIGAKFRDGRVSAVELTQRQLDAIDRHNGSLCAYLHVDRAAALAQAREAGHEIAAGRYRGALHGVPIAIKDLIDVRGMPTSCASPVHGNRLARADATVVARLRQAGAVLLGKLNMTEFALSGYHPERPVARNPWNRDAWAGVSSSGSAVASAAGLAFGTLGTDTGGSIRFPSAVNGVVGLKPSFGTVSRRGVFPLAESLDHVGPIARRVDDVALLFNCIAGVDDADPYCMPGRAGAWKPGSADGLAGLRVGVDESYVRMAHPEVAEAVLAAAGSLSSLGAHVVEVELHQVIEACSGWATVVAVEAAMHHLKCFPERARSYGPVFRDLLEAAPRVRASDYAAARLAGTRAATVIERALDVADVLLCPGAPLPAMALSDYPPSAVMPPETVAGFLSFCAPTNFSGHPTLSLPCGFSAEGLPLGMQLVGARGAEALLFCTGKSYEDAHDWKDAVPSGDSWRAE